jgi:capsular exopolysaccharide synthesis family protein
MPGYYDDDAPDFSLREVLDTLRRRKWVILQAFLFVTIIGVVTAALSPPVYSTVAKLLVETPGGLVLSQVNANDALAPLMAMRQQKSVDTQLAIMRSAEFQKRVYKRVKAGESTVGASLEYKPVENTSIIAISAESTDPKAVAAWANAAADEYVTLTRQSNSQAIRTTREYLDREAKKAKHQLDVAERKLLAFKSRTAMEGSEEERSIRLKESVDVDTKVQEARSEVLTLGVKIQQLKLRLAKEPETLKQTKILPNPEVEAVRSQIAKLKADRAVALGLYTPGSAKIQDFDAQIGSLHDAIIGLPTTVKETQESPNVTRENLVNQLKEFELQREASMALAKQLGTSATPKSKRVAQFAPWQVQLAQIQRERDQAEKTFVDYSDKLRELNVREQAEAASASLMEEAAVPSSPIRPQKAQQVAMAMVMGLLLGVGFAFLQEFLDDRVNTSEDVERLTSLPTLAVVPTIPDEDNRLLIGQDALSLITESYRALRTSVHFSAIDKEIRSILVTSSHSGEGKSVTSSNMAIAMALEGKRVILVDADLRRPSIHRLFKTEANPGLSTVLAGDTPLDDALQATRIENLRVLPSGPTPPNPAELLSSQAMHQVIEQLLERADLVIFDTPPVIPVTDAQVLAPQVDGIVLVVEAGQARKAAVKHARDLLEQSRTRILGVVMNKIDQTSKGYYYHYYYRGGYGKYGYRYRRGYGYGYGQGYGHGEHGGRHKLGDAAENGNGKAHGEDEALEAGAGRGEGAAVKEKSPRLPSKLKDWE